MAKIESLGIHTPVALPYLIREGLLPTDPKPGTYQWDTFVFHDGRKDVEEELLSTKTCVAWSQGTFVRNIYRFELEAEPVTQALLTSFADGKLLEHEDPASTNGVETHHAKTHASSRQSIGQSPATLQQRTLIHARENGESGACRALVVILKTKLHVYFLQGSHHIVDLPFEVERAFAAPRGLLLQRKLAFGRGLPPPAQVPSAPKNSFITSHPLSSASFLQSTTSMNSIGGAQSGDGKLDALFQEVIGSPSREATDDAASLYTLTSPLSDLGIVTYSLQHQKPRMSGRARPGLSVEFDGLEPAEQLIYVSSQDELAGGPASEIGSLALIVTANNELQHVTLWHAWYVEERSLQSLLKQRAAQKAAKAKRRSSFLSASMGTGATTPAARQREHTRESFAAPGRLPGEAQHATTSSRKPTRQEEEEIMASQMDPDVQPLPSHQPARDSRRISSLNAEVRASQCAAHSSFVAGGSRRNASFGGPHERRSLGHRKSRGSTLGSVLGMSLGAGGDVMDVDSDVDPNGSAHVESVLRHIRATVEAAGADAVFGGTYEDTRRDMVIQKLHTYPVSSPASPSGTGARFRVVTLRDRMQSIFNNDAGLSVYIHDETSKDLQCIKLAVVQRALWPELTSSGFIAIPTTLAQSSLGKSDSVIGLTDDKVKTVLLSKRGVLLSPYDDAICSLPTLAPYRAYHPLEAQSPIGAYDKDIGRNRILSMPGSSLTVSHTGAQNTYDEVDLSGTHHRRRLQLRPSDAFVERTLQMYELILPRKMSTAVRRIWCAAYAWLGDHPDTLSSTASDSDWVALTTTMFAFVLPLIDEKARAALNIARLAAGKHKLSESASLQLHKERRESDMFETSAWTWMYTQPSLTGHATASALSSPIRPLDKRKDQFLPVAAALALQLSHPMQYQDETDEVGQSVTQSAAKLMLGLHVLREEQKLCNLTSKASKMSSLAPLVAQLGFILHLDRWTSDSGTFYNLEGANEERWAYVRSTLAQAPTVGIMEEPVSIYQWFEHVLNTGSPERYPSLAVIAGLDASDARSESVAAIAMTLTPRIVALSNIMNETLGMSTAPSTAVKLMLKHKIDHALLETLPEAIAAPFRNAVALCEREPPTRWTKALLHSVGREDLDMEGTHGLRSASTGQATGIPLSSRDIQTICHAINHTPHHSAKTREASRHTVSQLIFSEDRRLVESTSLMHYNSVQVAECHKQPDWTDAFHFEQCRRVMRHVVTRMIALPAGDAMIHFDSQTPLLTEKYHLIGFSSACLMQPMNHGLQVDRSGLSEEKVNWAFFHAGASAGLRISRNVKGIDTSFIAFNKPSEQLTNRHAGLLLALGLNGHLRSLAKWLSFKYLTPKHMMTSVGLLLGLSASHIGTMDSLITRMLSVHITRMLPAGAAELNVSSTTQTAGLMGIGLLYYNTQHHRMSEIMLSEIENMEPEDPDSGLDTIRDESYRLAAGFALGLINLAKGKNLQGLHGMRLPERLLGVAVGPRPVGAVHVFDRATAGAIIAVALVYMKSGDRAMARKIDIPDTEAQFDQVRPDMLLLRAMARQIILWADMPSPGDASSKISGWVASELPPCYQGRLSPGRSTRLKSSDVAFYNIVTGLVWALGLKFAGSGNESARSEILKVYDVLYAVKAASEAYYYDAKLARSSIRGCMDAIALAAATVMAGTGDIETFRYLRRLHGRTDAETPYGSHLAAHMAIGVLFLGGGTYTFGTSDLAIAALMCAFYPLFPTDVQDNHGHLQAFRHLWVFAAEARCLVIEDIDTRKPISMPIIVTKQDGSALSLKAPCLLPQLDTIATVHTDDPAYWRVTLDFAANPAHLAAFRQNQHVFVRRCPASEAHKSAFSATLAAMNASQLLQTANDLCQSVFSLTALHDLDRAAADLILPVDVHSSMHTSERGTVVDDRLVLNGAVNSNDRDALWNLRILFAWAERAREDGHGTMRWLADEVIEMLKAKIEERSRSTGGSSA